MKRRPKARRAVELWGKVVVPFPLFLPASRALRGGGKLPVFRSASVGDNPSASSSSAAGLGEWKSQLIFAETLSDGGVRFVFLVSAEEFKIETTPDMLGGNWRPLADEEFEMIREDNVDGQDRLTIILPKAEGKQRFLRLTPQR